MFRLAPWNGGWTKWLLPRSAEVADLEGVGPDAAATAVEPPDTHPTPKNAPAAKAAGKTPLNPSNAGVDYTWGEYGLVWHGYELRRTGPDPDFHRARHDLVTPVEGATSHWGGRLICSI